MILKAIKSPLLSPFSFLSFFHLRTTLTSCLHHQHQEQNTSLQTTLSFRIFHHVELFFQNVFVRRQGINQTSFDACQDSFYLQHV